MPRLTIPARLTTALRRGGFSDDVRHRIRPWKLADPYDEPTDEEIQAAEEARTERLIDAADCQTSEDYDDAPYA